MVEAAALEARKGSPGALPGGRDVRRYYRGQKHRGNRCKPSAVRKVAVAGATLSSTAAATPAAAAERRLPDVQLPQPLVEDSEGTVAASHPDRSACSVGSAVLKSSRHGGLQPAAQEESSDAEEGGRDAHVAKAALSVTLRLLECEPSSARALLACKLPGVGLPCAWAAAAEKLAAGGGHAARPAGGERRHSVSFNLTLNEVHEVIPYAEIFGVHPRDFVFDRHLQVVPSGDQHGFVDVLAAQLRGRARWGEAEDDGSDSDSSDGDDWDSPADDWRIVVHRS